MKGLIFYFGQLQSWQDEDVFLHHSGAAQLPSAYEHLQFWPGNLARTDTIWPGYLTRIDPPWQTKRSKRFVSLGFNINEHAPSQSARSISASHSIPKCSTLIVLDGEHASYEQDGMHIEQIPAWSWFLERPDTVGF